MTPEWEKDIKDNYEEIINKCRNHVFGMAFDSPVGRNAVDTPEDEREKIFEENWNGSFRWVFETFDDLLVDPQANQMAADFIENYVNKPAFQFIKDVPVDWDTTVVVNGEIGEYVTIARRDRNSQDWYLGSITNEESRTFDVDLSFLAAKAEYTAEIYADGPNADWELNPYEMSIRKESVGTSYKFKLARGGGHAVRFRHKDLQ